ncbi:MAG: hypothetical protein ACRDZX_03255 [Acidimicrobiales bacterium]
MHRAGPSYWRLRLAKWAPAGPAREGYTLLVPVPGDIPVFLRLALAVCRFQQSGSRVETVVVPDALTQPMRDIVAAARADWPGELRLQPLPPPERWALPRLGDPGRNHALQLVTGVSCSRATHVVLHDADLFLLEPDVLESQFRHCRDQGLACLGTSPPWDPWYAEHGRHLAATWELCARTDWLRRYPPFSHMAHEEELFGERHMFDTTFYPQALTAPELIAVRPVEALVHFNYVISNYRKFLRRGGEGWHDRSFRLLLVCLLVELFDPEGAPSYRVPALGQLACYLGDASAPVQLPAAAEGVAEYAAFRELLERALSGPWAAGGQQELARAVLGPFDSFYAYAGEAVAPPTSRPGG